MNSSEEQGRRETWIVSCVGHCSAYLNLGLSCVHSVSPPALVLCDIRSDTEKVGPGASAAALSHLVPLHRGSRVPAVLIILNLLCDVGQMWAQIVTGPPGPGH